MQIGLPQDIYNIVRDRDKIIKTIDNFNPTTRLKDYIKPYDFVDDSVARQPESVYQSSTLLQIVKNQDAEYYINPLTRKLQITYMTFSFILDNLWSYRGYCFERDTTTPAFYKDYKSVVDFINTIKTQYPIVGLSTPNIICNDGHRFILKEYDPLNYAPTSNPRELKDSDRTYIEELTESGELIKQYTISYSVLDNLIVKHGGFFNAYAT